MLAAEVVGALPGTLSTAVLFRLEALRPLVDDRLLCRMFSLPGTTSLEGVSHVVLTPVGPVLADGVGLRLPSGALLPDVATSESLLRRFREELALLPAGEPDCLGVGQQAGSLPVGLHVSIRSLECDGVAVVGAAPDPGPLQLLRAVGVTYEGARPVGDRFLVRFSNRLDQHLMAAALSGFVRTDHCNLFFVGQAHVDPALRRGLRCAAGQRITFGQGAVQAAVVRLGAVATTRPVPMTSVAPAPAPPAAYGDLVPLGFVGLALAGTPTGEQVRRHLAARAQQGLWSFQTGGLPTATDTSLVALGCEDPRTPDRLQEFEVSGGGFVPQHVSERPEPGRMLQTPAVAHWCAEDFATSCLAWARTGRSRPPREGTWRWLGERFESRGGLFFANPFLVDWALSLVLAHDPGPAGRGDDQERRRLQVRLRDELLAAQHADGSFGAYEPALSTSLAVLALANLHERGRPVLLAQLSLLDHVGHDGCLPACTPFFSTLRVDGSSRVGLPPQHFDTGSGRHSVTWYRDDARMVGSALGALALAVPADDAPSSLTSPALAHPRYGCGPLDYVAGWALPSARSRAGAPEPGRTEDGL